jgi:mono/diheme cytochrome c family protein
MKLIIAGAATLAYIVMQLSSMSGDIKSVRTDHVKTEKTKAALVGTACATCHGPESGNMLPIRKTMSEEHFDKWVRGTRAFVGYTACPAVTAEVVTDADIRKIYSILYK